MHVIEHSHHEHYRKSQEEAGKTHIAKIVLAHEGEAPCRLAQLGGFILDRVETFI